jgi:hypothetical protein
MRTYGVDMSVGGGFVAPHFVCVRHGAGREEDADGDALRPHTRLHDLPGCIETTPRGRIAIEDVPS